MICASCVRLVLSAHRASVKFVYGAEIALEEDDVAVRNDYLDSPSRSLPHDECERAFDPIRMEYRVNRGSWSAA